jgi:transposase
VQQRETGSLARKPSPGRPRAISREHEVLLRARLEAAPDATVLEHCAWWEEHPGPQLARGDDGAGHPPFRLDAYQKTLAVATRDPERFVLVNESGTHTALTWLSGWAPHEGRASGSVPRNHGTNTSVGAAITPEGLREPWLIAAAMETATFAWDITEQLAPTLRPGQVVVLDNLSAHQSANLREALAARGGALLFLPPSSPDFMPIEQAFSKLKAILRGLGARTREAFEAEVRLALDAITRADATAWFSHAGYSLPAQEKRKLL